MKRLRRVSIVLVALLLSLASSNLAQARPSKARLERLIADISEVLAREGVPGAGIALVDRDGLIWTGGVGVADKTSHRPVTEKTLFRAGSVTKSFVALAAARLHERGQINIDTPLASFIPDVEMDNRWHKTHPVTWAHALEHTAGFDDVRLNEYWGENGEAMPLRDVLAINPRSRTTRWKPGTQFSYSNPGYTVVAAALESVTHRPYAEVIRAEVFGPLGIRDVHFGRSPQTSSRLATGYLDASTPTPYRSIYHHPAGALITTPSELAKLVLHGLNNRHSIVGPAMLARVERSETLPYDQRDVQYGLGNQGDVSHGTICRGHDGGVPGYLASYRYCRDAGIGYVLMINSTHSLQAWVRIQHLIFQALAEDRTIPVPPREDPDTDEKARVRGFYASANPRNSQFAFLDRLLGGIEIVEEEGELVAQPLLGPALPLVRTGAQQYRLPHEGGSSIQFTTGANPQHDSLLWDGVRLIRGRAWWAKSRLWMIVGVLVLTQLCARWYFWLALSWVFDRFFHGSADGDNLRVLAAPAAASLCAVMGLHVLVRMTDIDALMRPTPLSVGLCIGTLLFALLSGLAMAQTVRRIARFGVLAGPGTVVTRGLASLTSIACFGFTLWLTYHGIIGIRTWAG